MAYIRKATASLPLDTLDGGGVASVTLQDERYGEKQRVLAEFNDTRMDYSRNKCIHELFIEQVALHSGKIAVVCGEEQLTYQQLYERSQDLALYLQSLGVKPDSLVGLCMERSLDMVVGLLGILQAGGAYVPLDPDYPDERLAHMLQDSQTAIVLTQEKLQDKLSTLMPVDTLAGRRGSATVGDRRSCRGIESEEDWVRTSSQTASFGLRNLHLWFDWCAERGDG